MHYSSIETRRRSFRQCLQLVLGRTDWMRHRLFLLHVSVGILSVAGGSRVATAQGVVPPIVQSLPTVVESLPAIGTELRTYQPAIPAPMSSSISSSSNSVPSSRLTVDGASVPIEQRYPPEVLNCAICRQRLGLPPIPGLRADPSHGQSMAPTNTVNNLRSSKPGVSNLPSIGPTTSVSSVRSQGANLTGQTKSQANANLPPLSPSPILNGPNAAPYIEPDFRSLTPLASAAMQRAGQRRSMIMPPVSNPSQMEPNFMPAKVPTDAVAGGTGLPAYDAAQVVPSQPNVIASSPNTSSSISSSPSPSSSSSTSLNDLPADVRRKILAELDVPQGARVLSYDFQSPTSNPPASNQPVPAQTVSNQPLPNPTSVEALNPRPLDLSHGIPAQGSSIEAKAVEPPSVSLGSETPKLPLASKVETPEPKSPVQTSPVQTSPVQTSPVQTSPVQTSPVQTSPVQTSPVQTSPVQTSPVQTSPVQTSPVQTSPVQTSPVQTSPVQTSPVQTSPVQTSPVPATSVNVTAKVDMDESFRQSLLEEFSYQRHRSEQQTEYMQQQTEFMRKMQELLATMVHHFEEGRSTDKPASQETNAMVKQQQEALDQALATIKVYEEERKSQELALLRQKEEMEAQRITLEKKLDEMEAQRKELETQVQDFRRQLEEQRKKPKGKPPAPSTKTIAPAVR